jgi:hypothetical protein
VEANGKSTYYYEMRSEVLTAVEVSMLVFWVSRPVDLQIDTNVSKENAASIFRTEVRVLGSGSFM